MPRPIQIASSSSRSKPGRRMRWWNARSEGHIRASITERRGRRWADARQSALLHLLHARHVCCMPPSHAGRPLRWRKEKVKCRSHFHHWWLPYTPMQYIRCSHKCRERIGLLGLPSPQSQFARAGRSMTEPGGTTKERQLLILALLTQ